MKTARKLDAAWLREGPVPRLLTVLDSEVDEARIVGGAVRNALIGEPVDEIDIATTARPEDIVLRAEKAGFKSIPTGIAHGTVTVVADGVPYEVTTLREDVETDGRHAKVSFGRDWTKDAARRDFTINALSVGRDGTVYDYTGGLDDLAARRVRFIGDPGKRIAEDYLRILRFFRFFAAYGHGKPDPAALHACIAGRDGIDRLSRERVRSELMKLLVAPRAADALDAMVDAGLLVRVIGGVPNVAHLRAMVAIEETPDAVLRLGALAVLVGEDADRLRERLRLTNLEHARLVSMADGWWQVTHMSGGEMQALLYRLGPERYRDRVMLAFARASEADPKWRSLLDLPKTWTAPAFPLKATDFMQRGVGKGPALGLALAKAESAWIAAGFPLDDAALSNIADAAGQ